MDGIVSLCGNGVTIAQSFFYTSRHPSEYDISAT